jgi:iron complex outermembrane receptor protein
MTTTRSRRNCRLSIRTRTSGRVRPCLLHEQPGLGRVRHHRRKPGPLDRRRRQGRHPELRGLLRLQRQPDRRLKVSLGARATRDDKRWPGSATSIWAPPARRSPAASRVRSCRPAPTTAPETFSQFTPRVSVSYELNDDLTTYASSFEGLQVGRLGHARRRRPDHPADRQRLQSRDGQTYETGLKGYLPSTASSRSPRRSSIPTTRTSRSRPRWWCPSASPARRQRRRLDPVRREFESWPRRGQPVGQRALGYIHAEYDFFGRFVPAGAPKLIPSPSRRTAR